MQKRTLILSGILGVLAAASGVYYLAGTALEDLRGPTSPRKPTANRTSGASTRPTTRRSTSRPFESMIDSTLLLTELPRQALLIAGASASANGIDPAIDYSAREPSAVRSKYNPSNGNLEVIRSTPGGTAGEATDFPVPTLASHFIDYATLTAKLESWSAGQVPESASPKQFSGGHDADVPSEVTSLLEQVDINHSFLAARELHRLILSTGESPERLSALARAYAHLADSTRGLFSAHPSVFFARAAIYAERAARIYPNSPLGQAARGYVYTLHGQTTAARAAFENARALSGKANSALPEWCLMAEDLAHFRTRALFDKIDSNPSLASYFMMLSVEFSGLNSITVNSAGLALKHNPRSIRAKRMIEQNSTMQISPVSPDEETQRLTLLAAEKGATLSIRQAAAEVVRSGISIPGLQTVLTTMETEAPEPGQLLSWGTFASIWRDELFASELGYLTFTLEKDFGEQTSELARWWPLLKDHRFASVMAGFDSTGKLGSPKARSVAQRLEVLAYWEGFPDLPLSAKQLNPTPGGRPWLESYNYTSDDTTYDLARALWRFRDSDADLISILGMVKGNQAKQLKDLCPDHPSALAESIVNRWHEYVDQTAQIERDYGGNPQIAFALARAYRLHGRQDDSVRVFEDLVSAFPDRTAYEMLAELYERRGDQEKWLAAMEKYLADSQDFAVDHAVMSQKVAETFMRMQRPDRALKFAETAAGTPRGMVIYSYCLTELKRYDEAERVVRDLQRRSPESQAWIRWCHATGKGDLAAATAAAIAAVPQILAKQTDEDFNDLAIMYYLQGDRAKAREYWERDLKGSDASAFDALMVALLDLEDGKPDAAKNVLSRAPIPGMAGQPDPDETFTDTFGMHENDLRGIVYRVAIDEALRCLEEPGAAPRRDGSVSAILISRGKAFRSTAAYFLGRFCELRGQREDALYWYRISIDGEWTNSSLPLASEALRRLESSGPSTVPTTSPVR